jgi:hypothetical protein
MSRSSSAQVKRTGRNEREVKSVWLTIVIGLALGKGVLGADDIERTYSGKNGRGWQSLTLEMRIGYIEGYYDGVATGVVHAAAPGGSPAGAFPVAAAKKAFAEIFPVSMTVGEIVSAVDRFYAEPLNRRIMVYSALPVIALEAKGTDQATVDGEIRRLRRNGAAEEPVASLPHAK